MRERYTASLRPDGNISLITLWSGNIGSRDLGKKDVALSTLNADEARSRVRSRDLGLASVLTVAVGALAFARGSDNKDRRLKVAGAVSAGLGAVLGIASLTHRQDAERLNIQSELVDDLSPEVPNSSFPQK